MPAHGKSQQLRLLDEVRQVLRLHHYSIHTERADKKVNVPPVVMTGEEVAAAHESLTRYAALSGRIRATSPLIA